MSDADLDQITRVLAGMRRWREAEQKISLRSRASMNLNETDMKALRFLAVAKNEGRLVTARMLADHLGISSASMTKLLDRLEAAGHIERAPHPNDRRALVINIAGRTHEDVRDTVGRTHARRFGVVAALTPAEREIVIRFLGELADLADGDAAPAPSR